MKNQVLRFCRWWTKEYDFWEKESLKFAWILLNTVIACASGLLLFAALILFVTEPISILIVLAIALFFWGLFKLIIHLGRKE